MAGHFAMLRRMIRTLERSGYSVIAAGDGDEAWSMFQTRSKDVDLLFADVMMPGISGIELARRCLGLKPSLPVLLASGYARGSLGDDNEGEVSFEVLPKPYDLEMLRARIAEALKAARTRMPREAGACCPILK